MQGKCREKGFKQTLLQSFKKSRKQQNASPDIQLNRSKQISVRIKNSSSKRKSKSSSLGCTFTNDLMSNSKQKVSKMSKQNKKLKSNSLQHRTGHQISMKNLNKQHIGTFAKQVRKNNKKFISRQNSSQKLEMRLPWGVNQHRLNNYVLETLTKMQKLRRAHCHQDTFNTEKSQALKQSDIRVQLTPKKQVEPALNKELGKISDRVIKSPTYQEKTDKKNQNFKQASQDIKTEKQRKDGGPIKKEQNMVELIIKSFTGQFQCIERNNLYSINFRVVNNKIIQLQLAVVKKIDSLTINLSKGSLICQSINETYQNISPKSSLILMTAVSAVQKFEKFVYPELQILISEKNGSFAMQKKVALPYCWLSIYEITPQNQLKQKHSTKIKSKSVIEHIHYRKQLCIKMDQIFKGNFQKYKHKDQLVYLYGYQHQKQSYLIRLIVDGNKCSLQCESASSNIKQILQMLQVLLCI